MLACLSVSPPCRCFTRTRNSGLSHCGCRQVAEHKTNTRSAATLIPIAHSGIFPYGIYFRYFFTQLRNLLFEISDHSG